MWWEPIAKLWAPLAGVLGGVCLFVITRYRVDQMEKQMASSKEAWAETAAKAKELEPLLKWRLCIEPEHVRRGEKLAKIETRMDDHHAMLAEVRQDVKEILRCIGAGKPRGGNGKIKKGDSIQ